MLEMNALVAALGGGMFGAILGGTPGFAITGLLVLAGVAAASIDPAAGAIINDVAFGPFFGPHVMFGGAAAAAAYAYKRGFLESGKDTTTALIKFADPGTLIVGAVFGLFGWLLNSVFVNINLPTDTIALTVVISNIIARLLWGNGLFGKVPAGKSMMDADETNAWLIWQKDVPILVLMGAGLGAAVGWATLATGNGVIGFGIAAFSLVFLMTLGAGPVWHQIAAPAGTAALLTGNIWMAVVFGIVGALLGEFIGARMFFNNGDTHIDPPAVGIFITVAIVLALFG